MYSAQETLPGWGPTGQAHLAQSRVLVVGCGGLGCPALVYLAAAGVGTLGLCDPDRVEAGNLHRQILFSPHDLGQNKAQAAAGFLTSRYPDLQTVVYPQVLGQDLSRLIFPSYDLVLDATDNFLAQFILHDGCFHLGIPLVQGNLHRWEARWTFFPFSEGYQGPCLRCLYPRVPQENSPCGSEGIAGPVAGMGGTQMAVLALRHLLGLPSLSGGEMGIQSFDGSPVAQKLTWKKDPLCPCCGGGPDPVGWSQTGGRDQELGPGQLGAADWEHLVDLCPAEGMAERHRRWRDQGAREIQREPAILERGKTYLVICPRGSQSRQWVRLRSPHTPARLISLAGGDLQFSR